jgi:uncharacterized protein YidB (DUF937 family)
MRSSIEDLLGGLLGGSGSGSGGALGGLGGLGSLLGGGGSGGGAGALTALIPVVTGMLAGGGLSKILSGMSAAGLDDKAKSWVSTGESKPISADEVKQVVDKSQIDEVAAKAGVSHDEAAGLIAQALPAMVDHVTPDGTVPDAAAVDDKLAQIQAASR